MRCLSCNANLTDFESTRKSANTGQYIDLCNHCFGSIKDDMYTIERADLDGEEVYDENPELSIDKDSEL